MLFMMTDRIDENLKNSLQVDLDKMAPGLHVQVMPTTKAVNEDMNTENEERFAGLNCCVFRGFQEHCEGFPVNLYTSFI